MSAWMALAQAAGYRHAEQPPKRIVEHALNTASVQRPTWADNALAVVAHVTYGATLGVIYRWLRSHTRIRGPAVVQGMAYGAGVWATNYAGWIPAVGIMPPPHRDKRGRPGGMFLAHLIFGGVVGALGDPFRDRRTAAGQGRR